MEERKPTYLPKGRISPTVARQGPTHLRQCEIDRETITSAADEISEVLRKHGVNIVLSYNCSCECSNCCDCDPDIVLRKIKTGVEKTFRESTKPNEYGWT